MSITMLCIFFILGTCFGSFYTVVATHLVKDEPFLTTRSKCDNCSHPLSLLDMIPILSYIFLRGKCRYCHTKIDPLSTYMEIFSGILFTTAYYVFGPTYELFMALGIISLLLIVIITDVSSLIIPDELLIFMSLYFTIFDLLNIGIFGTLKAIGDGIILFLIMYFIMLIGNFIFKKESLGGGDIKMMFIFGHILGILAGIFSIFLGSIIALPISIMFLVKEKEHVIPFGPFLLIALTLMYFTGINSETILNFLRW
ncbi:MAG: prepilin peptidase [Bacilli bacterium]|nr:prepilin peptidase [Bacilli bacterium]